MNESLLHPLLIEGGMGRGGGGGETGGWPFQFLAFQLLSFVYNEFPLMGNRTIFEEM